MLHDKKIMIAEDEDDLRELLVEIFNSTGATTFSAPNGNLAFEQIQKNPVDILITDIRMPGGDGVSLIRRINQEMNPKPKVFICSAYNDLTEADIIAMGVIATFPKPFKFTLMLETVTKAVASS